MKYLLLNASPRGRQSNSRLLLSKLADGMYAREVNETDVDIIDLRPLLSTRGWEASVEEADVIIICFPLYADHVPGILKKFIEELGRDSLKGKKLGWICHCGFPESIHMLTVEKYLAKLTNRLGAEQAGIIKKAGSEGSRMMPPSMTARLFKTLNSFGEDLASSSRFDSERIKALSVPEKFGPGRLLLMRIMNLTGLSNFYWNSNLKKNGAFDKKADKPYIPD